MSRSVAPNPYKLVFDFNGNLLLGGLVGLYRSNYTNSANQSVGLAVTKFTQINARKAFPCFDEPTFRSVFETTIVHEPEKTLTIGNMPIASETVLANGWVETRFQPSVSMVSYLDAFIVSDFACNQTDATYFPIRVCASPQLTYKSGYALEVTPKIFDHFEQYLGHDYQLPKCDLIALPQYAAGATEKWGIVLFLDSYLLWEENENTATNKMGVASIVAHEMAHMWFGNLVTCKWWSDLWLNEGFASFMEYTSVNASEPDWDYWDTFLMLDFWPAMNADSSPNSHPIVRTVNNNALITSYTSAIIYQKGSTVLRMLEFVMTPENFRTGIQHYLNETAWQSVETSSLWRALDPSFPNELNATIYEFMDPWITKSGFPYVNITRIANTVTITQRRYLSNGQQPAIDTVWLIPLSYYTSLDSRTFQIEIIKTKQQTIAIENADQSLNGLIKFNTNSNGMYIVNYPEEDWNNWSDVLTKNSDNIVTKLTVSDRANFLIDSLLLSRAKLLPYLTPLNISRYLINERHLTPWTIAINQVYSEVQRYMSITEYKQDLRLFFSSLAQPLYNNLRWNDSDGTVITKRLRSLIVEFICGNYHSQCLADASMEFANWRSGLRIGPNLLQSTLRYGIRQSNQTDDWNYLWDAYIGESSQSIKLNYLNALSYTTDSSLINELLNRSLNTFLIPDQYFVNVLNYVAANSDGLPIVWDFYRNNYLILAGRLTVTNLGNVLNTICGYFGDNSQKTEVQNFFNQYPNTGVSASDRLRVIRTIDDNIGWMSEFKDLVGNWLQEVNSKLD